MAPMRDKLFPQVHLSDAEIFGLVREFYGRVRSDEVLGPIFEHHVHDWDTHLVRMDAFWSSVINASGRYKGLPMLAHMGFDELRPSHFARWLGLFEAAARDQLSPDHADFVVSRAEKIAESFKLGLSVYRGETLPRVEH